MASKLVDKIPRHKNVFFEFVVLYFLVDVGLKIQELKGSTTKLGSQASIPSERPGRQ